MESFLSYFSGCLSNAMVTYNLLLEFIMSLAIVIVNIAPLGTVTRKGANVT